MADIGNVIKFLLRIDTETNADKTANSVDELNAQIKAHNDVLKNLQATQRNLKGSSDEVVAARKRIKDSIEVEKNEISRSTLELVKRGETVKKVTKAENDLSAAAKLLGSNTQQLVGKFETLGAGLKAFTSPGVAAIAITAGLAAGFLAVGAAAIKTSIDMATFVIKSADARRSQLLLDEAASGSADNAKALESQIDALSGKVATNKQELRDLARELALSFQGTYAGGQGVVDALNAIGQTAAAVGPQAASKIREIFERSKNFGRFGIAGGLLNGIDELQGTGLKRDDIATQLAKRLKIGTDAAKLQLATFRTSTVDGLAATRAAIEAKFGPINGQLALSLPAAIDKLKQRSIDLAAKFDIRPVIDAFAALNEYLAEGSQGAEGLKAVFEGFGDIIGLPFKNGKFNAREFTDFLVFQALKIEGKILDLELAGQSFWKDLQNWKGGFDEALKAATILGKVVLSIASAVETIAKISDVGGNLTSIRNLVSASVGVDPKTLTEGLKSGVESALPAVAVAGIEIGKTLTQGTEGQLEVHSPSRVFERIGKQTVAGFTDGIDGAQGAIDDSLKAFDVAPDAGAASGGAGRAGAPAGASAVAHVTINVDFPNAKSGSEVAAAFTEATFRSKVTRVFEEAFQSAGISVAGGH